jgi:hypothetical protein
MVLVVRGFSYSGPYGLPMKRIFGIDIETCPACGVAVKVIANIEE